jgi:uncharacterized protein YbaR (Trm112 family)
MRSDLLNLICCPACLGSLTVERTEQNDRDGTLRCWQCGACYPLIRGVPHLFCDDDQWVAKAREADGWVQQHKLMGIYEQGPDAVDLKLPYYPEDPWINVARSFDIALYELQLTGNETVLDLGAGRGWAAKQFALRGCRAVALDITPDENIGLGRSWALMAQANTCFYPVIGDGERLPFFPEQLDIVFLRRRPAP